jgi:hypothetical protein
MVVKGHVVNFLKFGSENVIIIDGTKIYFLFFIFTILPQVSKIKILSNLFKQENI